MNDIVNKLKGVGSGGGALKLIVGGVLGLLLLLAIPSLVENQDAGEVMVIQSAFTGELSVYTEPGPKWQGFGKVTTYPRRDQYSFSAAKDQGGGGNQAIKTGFNDGGTGYVSGVMSWEMPLKTEQIIRLHKEYGSFTAIDQQLIRPMLEKVIFTAGATMSSIESSSERKPEIPQTIDDQLQNGPFLTKVVTTNITDPMTKQEKTVRTVQISTDAKTGLPIRASASTIKEYGISLSPVTVNDIVYEESVKAQIAERQKSTQAVQLSQASALKATQDAVTTEQKGKAAAAEAKWAQETIKAKVVTEAQQKFEVATLDAKSAEQYKRQQTLIGEGNGAKMRAEMQANGALEQKLATYEKVNGYWADAIAKHAGPLVPATVIGGSGNGGNSVQNLMDMIQVKTAMALGLDMSMNKK